MKSTKIIGIILSATLLFGCSEDFLDKTKLGALSTDKFFLTETDANQAVIAAYSDLKDYRYTWTIWAFGDVLSDDATYSGSAADVQAYATMESYNYPTDNGRILNRYQILFRGVNKANQAIDGISKMDVSVFKTMSKNQLLGEVLFLRAYYYHELVRVFGSVTLMTKTPTIADKTMTRTPVADVYVQIEQDLISAASFLPKKSNQIALSGAGRITKGAANAMLSRVYLYQKKYELCKTASKAVFEESYTLVPNYADVFTLAGEHGAESILEVCHYNSPTQSSAFFNNGNFHVLMMMPGGTTYGYGINQPSASLAAAFDAAGDNIRKDVTLLTQADLVLWETPANVAKLTNVRSGYWNQKYYLKPTERSVEIRNNPINIKLIRLPEVFLNYAEACAKAPTAIDGEAQARTYLNKVRTRVSLPDKNSTGDALYNDIINERRLELAMEGHRFFDMVRTGKAATAFAAKGNFRAGISDLLPIPQAEIDASGGLITQNPL
ncbi:MAG: RagB/SusD family nutrient uptake outer membrane protein [Paludibacter sp.]|nr:RagB/SusD family nutrient uptake outer membrane protein [Paludibacter sp.]